MSRRQRSRSQAAASSALQWPLALALGAVWLVMALGFKISSLAALVAATLMPVGMFWLEGNAPVAGR